MMAFTQSAPLGLSSWNSRTVLKSSPMTLHTFLTEAPPRRAASIVMASEENLEKKKAKVSVVRSVLNESLLLVSVPLDGLTVSNISELKDALPAGTSAACVKNTLMRRAIEDSRWNEAEKLTTQSSLWLFVREDMKNSVKAYKDFVKKVGRTDEIRGGVFEGEFCDAQGIEKVAALPTKQELITKIAIAIKAVPTKVARSIKAVPTKVGRAIKLAVAEEDSTSSSESDASSSD